MILSLITAFQISFAANTCPNLDGVWEGYCRSDRGNTNSITWDIRQTSCEEFYINQTRYTFGEYERHRVSNPTWDVTIHEKFNYNSQKDLYTYKRQDRGYHRPSARRLYASGFGDLQLKDDRLYFYQDMRYELMGRPTNIWSERTTCRFRNRIK